jgi:glycosyltransferase involved in cell wall biosynthesis
MRLPVEPELTAAGPRLVSVVIPARNEARAISAVIHAVQAQGHAGLALEIIVVDDGSDDDTAAVARVAGALVLELEGMTDGGNPARARNCGAAMATGDPIVFLDADCTPAAGWLTRLLAAHDAGAAVVGGALDLPQRLPITARCDYYCGWYHVHSGRRAGTVPNHPPGNLSVRRRVFATSAGFTEQQPVAYAHEELAWQGEVQRSGGRIVFEPRAIVLHHNRPGFKNLLKRNYRWGYSAIESKAATGAARHAWAYRHPAFLVAASVPLAIASTGYVIGCWLRAGVVEPLIMFPAVLAARLAYSAGLAAGGIRWIRHGALAPVTRPRWE